MQIKLSDDTLNILSSADIEGNVLRLTCGQLDRKMYETVNKALEALGGKWNRSKKAHVFETDPAEIVESAILAGEVTDFKKLYQFFPTPPALAERLVALAEVQHGHTVLEPSAGQGAIADAIRAKHPGVQLDVIEPMQKNREVLSAKGYEILTDDFLKFTGKYDRIVANPPFTKQQDVQHVSHMLDCLNPGGRVVSIMSAGVMFRKDSKTRAFLDRLAFETEYSLDRLPESSFADSGTNVNTCVLIADVKA